MEDDGRDTLRVIGVNDARSLSVVPLFERSHRVIKRRVVEDVEDLAARVSSMLAAAERHVLDAQSEADEIREAARAQGRAEGLRDALRQLAAAQKIRDEAKQAAEEEMLDLAFRLAAHIVGQSAALDRSIITDAVVARLREVHGAARIIVRVSPADAQHLESSRNLLAPYVDGVPLIFEPSTDLGPGDCVIETDRGRADARIEAQLLALRAALDDGDTA